MTLKVMKLIGCAFLLAVSTSYAGTWSDDFSSYALGVNAGSTAMQANGWSQIGPTSSGITTYYGANPPQYALWDDMSKAAVTIPASTSVTVEFDLLAAMPTPLSSPGNRGIVVELISPNGRTATFKLAAGWYYGGTNSTYNGGFQFTDGVDTYVDPNGRHMASFGYPIGYWPYQFKHVVLVYNGVTNTVSMEYDYIPLFTETLHTDFVIEKVAFRSAYVTNQGASPTASNAPWVIDNLTITYDGTATCESLISMGMGLAADLSGQNNKPDCVVNLYDFAALAAEWLDCNDPVNCM